MTSSKNNELKILNNAIKVIEKKKGKRLVESEENKKIIDILEKFLVRKKLICYGGTAINNILPQKYQFYDKNVELPDYDFFSTNALEDAKELADIYFKEKYEEVEAKAGVHPGTFKVFVNFKAIADVTQLDNNIFKILKSDAIIKDKIYYAPPDFLRMSMYLELSRPDGDVSRWEKVLKRLLLLNKNFPLKGTECNSYKFEREFVGNQNKEKIHELIKKIASREKLVFFGGYSLSLYSKYYKKIKLDNNPDFDLLSNNPLESATKMKDELKKHFSNITITFHSPIGENIPFHYEIKVGNDSIAFLYKTDACYNYNNVKINNKVFRIATIDTLLSFYLAFYYTKRPYYDKNRILCISEFLFKIQQKNKFQQKGILKRFTPTCYGKQKTIEEIRREKNYKYNLLKTKKNSKEFEYNFLKYNPNFNESLNKDKYSYISLKKRKTLKKSSVK
uniref:Putative poly(A) polymerase catalytic subunit n=1 Tax=Nucleocytoviricota sp. TaxID=2809609 RepID=A0A9E8G4X6_9VIRU|nr:putative polyA polymerase catalytic subunit [Nucleocytoviricota sp.]UZT29156.1 putative polyA polymerase catalytic subunit [Nucleocytoviricota sp.]